MADWGIGLRRAGACAFALVAVLAQAADLPPVRFALTFDDGPCGEVEDNSSELILDTLANNSTQKGIKAIFFAQTRSSNGGATPRGREVLAREWREGHVLALHDGSPWGHRSHRNLSDAQLEQTLADGTADLDAITHRATTLVRPPYWAFDARTLAAYRRYGLAMLLTDVSANDGKDWGFKASPRRYVHMGGEMQHVRERLERGEIPVIDKVVPIVVTFHDTNSYTARHMQEYLAMMVDKAHEAGLPVASPPFFDDAKLLEKAALQRSRDNVKLTDMVPWWWRWIEW